MALQELAVRVVEFEAMPVALEHDRLSIRPARRRARLQHAGIAAQAHGAALLRDVTLLRKQVDDRMRRERVEFGRVGVLRPEGRARELDDHALHTHAESQRGHAPLPAETRRFDLPLDAAIAEPARDDQAIQTKQWLHVVRPLEVLAVDPLQPHVAAGGPGRVANGLGDGEIRVGQLDVLSDEADRQRDPGVADPLGERAPLNEIRLTR